MDELLVILVGSPHQNVSFLKVAYDGEIGVFSDFFNPLYAMGVSEEWFVKMLWTPRKGKFIVASIHEDITSQNNNPLWRGSTWRNKATLKAAFSNWTANVG